MKILILQDVLADFPFLNAGKIKAGIHEAKMNKNGAVSCMSDTGEFIGVKLGEFKFLSSSDRENWVKIAYPDLPKVAKGLKGVLNDE